MLAAREALAAEPGADAAAKVDVGRSLIAVAGLLEATGKTDEALATYRRSESLLAGPAGADPSARAALAACRSRLGWLLSDHGQDRRRPGGLPAGAGRPGGAGRRPRGLERRPPRPGGHDPSHRRPAVGDGQAGGGGGRVPQGAGDPAEAGRRQPRRHRIPQRPGEQPQQPRRRCCGETGKPAEAEAEYRKALAIQQKLADDNPAVTEFRSGLADSHNNLGDLLSEHGQAGGGGGRVPHGAGDPAEAGRRQPRRHRLPQPPGGQPQQPRHPAVGDGQAGGGGGRVPQGAGDLPEAGRRQPRRHRLPQRPGGQPRAASASCCRDTGKPAEAEAEFRKALAIRQKLADDNPAVTDFRSRLADSHINLGILLSETGKPAEAEAEYRKALAIRQKLADDNPSVIDFRGGLSYDYLRVAALQAWFGQDKELSSTCEKLLSLAKDTEDPMVADKAAKCCSLRQADPKRRETALVLARRAVEHGKGSQWLVYFEMALGMAEYRSGHFAEADAALTAAMNDPGKNNTVSSTSAFYRAMGLFRQGKTDLARKLATEAAAKMKPLPVDEQKPLAGGADHDDLIMWLAYKEAKAMIQFDATPAAPAQPHTK